MSAPIPPLLLSELTRLQTAAETRPEGDDWGWDDRADIALEVSRLKEDLELSISDRDNALEARDALARQALMAGIQRSKFPVSGGKKWLNFALMVALLTGLAFFGKCFPSLIPGLEESGALPPEVQVRKEIVVPAADKTTKTEGTE